MAMWNRCAICGKSIPVGELCYGVKNWRGDPIGGDTICRDCLVPENAPTLTPPNEAPPCYQPDGDGCSYQCYDGDDEPIDKCKECPLCYSDKQRHHAPPNEPLTLEQLREAPHGKIKDSTLQSICNRANEIARRPPEGGENP